MPLDLFLPVVQDSCRHNRVSQWQRTGRYSDCQPRQSNHSHTDQPGLPDYPDIWYSLGRVSLPSIVSSPSVTTPPLKLQCNYDAVLVGLAIQHPHPPYTTGVRPPSAFPMSWRGPL